MPLPPWLKTKIRGLHNTKALLRSYDLHSVCEEARCPNQGLCFSRSVATFMILGNHCTRNCGFCAVSHGTPTPIDIDEPARIVHASKEMGLRYVVVTSVTRDDLPDGGAGQFAACIRALRKEMPSVGIEVLTPDFMGDPDSLGTILSNPPDVYNHNIETVPRLYPQVRPQADYERSIDLLRSVKALAPTIITKSGIMVGLGETQGEILKVMEDLRAANCDMLTIGQYMQPTRRNLPVYEYIGPEVFEHYRAIALEMGFKFVASAPLVRSSMNAQEMFDCSALNGVT